MTSGLTGMQIIVNDGEPMEGTVSIETQTEMVYSDCATKPDPAWRFVDAAGHFHSWARGDDYPTLIGRSRQVPCDGSCGGVCGGEGTVVIDRHCRICDELIEPGRVPASGAHAVTIGRSWTVEVQGAVGRAAEGRFVLGDPEMVTVRIIDVEHGVTRFGVAEVGAADSYRSPYGMTSATTVLYGRGELGDFSVPVRAVP